MRPLERPIDGQSPETHEMVVAYPTWIQPSPSPKLLVSRHPGAAISGKTVDFCHTGSNQTKIPVE
jgi:hypothetical protein